MRFCLACIFILISYATWSQSELHIANYYGRKDGLNNVAVYCLRQDNRGFLWLGTKEGLNRFDGFQFKEYYTERNNPNSLSHNKVFDILEYQPGLLLFATGSGLSVLNTKTGKFENERIQFPPLKARSGAIVTTLFQDPKQRVWIHHSGVIDVFDQNLNYQFRFTDADWTHSIQGRISSYESWYMDKKGRLWIPTDDSGLQIIDFDNQEIFNQNNNPDKLLYLGYNYIRSFLLDEQENTLWLGTWGEGLIKFDLSSKNMTQEYFNLHVNGESRTINSILKTAHGSLLFTINGDCYEMDPKTMAYKAVPIPDAQPEYEVDSKPSKISSTVMIRADGNQYWIGGEGLFQLNEQKMQNELVLIPPGQSELCTDLLVSHSGNIYSNHDNGWLVKVDKDRISVKHYPVPLHANSGLTRLYEDHAGQLWVGSTNGLQLFDPVKEVFYIPSFFPAELKTGNINVLFEDSDENFWIGTRQPFRLYHLTSNDDNLFQIEDKHIKQFSEVGKNGRISCITEDDQKRLWMASFMGGGILCYDMRNDRWTSYPTSTRNYSFLADKGIVSILPGKEEDLWLSTILGDGLVRYFYKADSLIQFTREQGLLSDYVKSITADNDENLWLTSEFGVTKFSKNASHSISNTVFETDWFSGETSETAIDAQNNQLILGLHDRYIFVPTKNNLPATPSPTPLLDRIYVNNKEFYIDHNQPSLRLKHDQKNVAIEFTAVHFTNADKLRFAYRLEGADEEWKTSSLNRNAQYASLSPGKYVFRLKVADESGHWGPDYTIMSFTIVPPFWRTAWFILCIIGSIVFTTFWIVKKRINTIRYEAGLKQQIAETEMMALRAQMNPHFIFNCINSIDSLIQDNDKYHATIYLNKFAKLIRSILDSSKQNTVPLANDLETLKLYIELEQFRSDNKFSTSIKADERLLQEDYKVPPLIIQPYVENAILHGLRNRRDNDGQLTISLSRMNGHLRYIIEDNGVGRMHKQNGHSNDKVSYGMQMSSDRVRLFNHEENASVEITDLTDNGMASGTRVEVLLKMI